MKLIKTAAASVGAVIITIAAGILLALYVLLYP